RADEVMPVGKQTRLASIRSRSESEYASGTSTSAADARSNLMEPTIRRDRPAKGAYSGGTHPTRLRHQLRTSPVYLSASVHTQISIRQREVRPRSITKHVSRPRSHRPSSTLHTFIYRYENQ